MATAQPITFNPSENDDLNMVSGSFNGSYNPSSFTRRMMFGSPISWRAGSFGTRFGISTSTFLDGEELKFGKLSSSIESDRESVVNAFNMYERQAEMCRDYTCCGQNLTDLHALVEHFEECHVVVLDQFAPHMSMQTGPLTAPPQQGSSSSYFSEVHQPSAQAPTYQQGAFDPDDMELDVGDASAPSSGAPSPPDTPISTPLSSYPSASLYSASAPPSTCSSPHPAPVSAFDTTTVLPSRSGHSQLPLGFPRTNVSPVAGLEDAFNTYAGYSDYSSLLPGTVGASSSRSAAGPSDADTQSPYGAARSTCVPPALLLNSSANNTPDSTPASSRVASPTPGTSVFRNVAAAPASTSVSGATANGQTVRASTTLSRPATSLLLSKPFKCPKPNCNKSYKQANGLKYHIQHGSCNFAPPKDLEALQTILAAKRGNKGDDEPISDAELREVEREAERRLRPYACGVGDCQRRYKNMNGLRYHYQHSGDHGAIGLALLASGQHECLQHSKSRHSTPQNNVNNNNNNTNASNNAPGAMSRSSPLAAQPVITRPQSASASSNYAASALQHPPSYQQAMSMAPPQYPVSQEEYRPTSSMTTPIQPMYMMPMTR